ncbi:MAG TPA: STAS domain-containing protein [Bryobacterales bacterium]|jgi:anti-sigma B factor antagonist|nr:STAS domain-containing protein [Bryobacterales bacterium]
MDLNVKRDGAKSVVYVVGDIDLHTSPELREMVLDLFRNRQQSQVIVNLAEVAYIDSSGIASLVEGLQEARKQNGRFVLVGLRDGPRHVLELTRLLSVFEIAETEEGVS